MSYVTDTHALVWYFTDDLRLSKKALEAFEQTTDEGIIYSTIYCSCRDNIYIQKREDYSYL